MDLRLLVRQMEKGGHQKLIQLDKREGQVKNCLKFISLQMIPNYAEQWFGKQKVILGEDLRICLEGHTEASKIWKIITYVPRGDK